MLWHYNLHNSVDVLDPRNSFSRSDHHFLHPTHVTLRRDGYGESRWSARHHRKQRYKALSPSQRPRKDQFFFQRLMNMMRPEVWNISWWYAVTFTLGSIVWVTNGFFVFLPMVNSHVAKDDNAAGWTAWLGATIFEAGAFFGILEAWNRDNTTDFGWNVEKHLLPRSATADMEGIGTSNDTDERPQRMHWKWFSTDTKYFREIGFLGAFWQLAAATIFWISGWTSIPSIQSAIMKRTGVLDGTYWTPQVVGGFGFMVSSVLIMLESQNRWYQPALLSLGWHVGCAIGFTLCGALGYAAEVSRGADYQSTLSTFWGGWAFLIGSVIQWYEAVNSVS